jgi:hypothetical protein
LLSIVTEVLTSLVPSIAQAIEKIQSSDSKSSASAKKIPSGGKKNKKKNKRKLEQGPIAGNN